MSNHARGLWAYFGATAAGGELTIQATGMGGPSAALVLGDLVELGVKRAVRIGTCVGANANGSLGDLLIVREAIAQGGSAAALGVEPGTAVTPDPELTGRLQSELDEGKLVTTTSVDAHPGEHAAVPGIAAFDMQTAPLIARATSLQIELAALLIVSEAKDSVISDAGGGTASLAKDELEELERRAGRAASAVLSG